MDEQFVAAPDEQFIRSPKVFLVGRQIMDSAEMNRFLASERVEWSSSTDVDSQALVESAGRICYMSFGKPRPGGHEAYMNNILGHGHGSVLEHAVFNFIFTGISRSLSHELVRHRAGFGYSQLSQRYVDESAVEFVEPDVIANDPECHAIFSKTVYQCRQAYSALTSRLAEIYADEPDPTSRRKLARQAARAVLPNATETKIFVTVNARAVRHFLELRGSKHADSEIRSLAIAVFDVVSADFPSLFSDFYKGIDEGIEVLNCTHKKV